MTDDGTASVLALAPVWAEESLVGILVAYPDTDASRANVASLQAAAIDFAALAGGVFGPDLLDTARIDASRRDFRRIADEREFEIFFQPIVRLDDLGVEGYEALARFDTGEFPLDVFAEAALVGAGHSLELSALDAAIEASSRLPADVWMSVNISPSVIVERDLGPHVARCADRQIVLELSELEPVGDYRILRDAVAALGTNVVLSVDDAGSGFASLSHILALGATYVKLDRSWVCDIDSDPAKRALVAGLQNFAIETGADVVAEGIETEAELETVRRLGIELGQGFLLGRPAPEPPT